MKADTFDRSCAHWSEAGRGEMERFYEIATVDYRHLAEARDWRSWLKAQADAVAPRRLKILDVACGSGKFPVALNRYANIGDGSLADIEYALLDPSRFSIDEARAALAPPFLPGAEYETTLQKLDCPAGAFDVVWATHALYAVPAAEMATALERLVNACSGEAFIAHAFADAHYLKFQRLFMDAFQREDETPYAAAEDVIAALTTLGVDHEVAEISYANGTAIEARDIVEGYLQRCVFDDGVSLAEMEASTLGPYLRECSSDGSWQFPQRVALISIGM